MYAARAQRSRDIRRLLSQTQPPLPEPMSSMGDFILNFKTPAQDAEELRMALRRTCIAVTPKDLRADPRRPTR